MARALLASAACLLAAACSGSGGGAFLPPPNGTVAAFPFTASAAALSPDGVAPAILAWNGATRALELRRWNGAHWVTAKIASVPNGFDVEDVDFAQDLAVDAAGAAHIAHLSAAPCEGGLGPVVVYERPDGAGWTPEVVHAFCNVAGGSEGWLVGGIHLALVPGGEPGVLLSVVHLVTVDEPPFDAKVFDEVYEARRAGDGVWRLDATPALGFAPAYFADARGRRHALLGLASLQEEQTEVVYRRNEGVGWEEDVLAAGSASAAVHAFDAAAAGDLVGVLYGSFPAAGPPENGRTVYAERRGPGDWAARAAPTLPRGRIFSCTRLALDSSGVPWVLHAANEGLLFGPLIEDTFDLRPISAEGHDAGAGCDLDSRAGRVAISYRDETAGTLEYYGQAL